MNVLSLIVTVCIYLVIFAIASFPLHLIIRKLGSNVAFVEVIIVNLVAAVLIGLLNNLWFLWGGLIILLILLYVYKAVFEINWGKSFVAWLSMVVMVGILVFVALLIEFSVGMSKMLI